MAAGKGNLVHARMRRECRARDSSITRHNIHDARGKTGFFDQFRQFHGADGRLLGGFENNGVTGGERGAELPGIEQHRRIPRQDRAHHADRFAPRIGQRVRPEWNLLALNLVCRAREKGEPFHRALHFAHRVTQRLAIIAAFDFGKLCRVTANQIRQPQQQLTALRWRKSRFPWPLHGGTRRCDRGIDIAFAAFGDFRPYFLGRRVDGTDAASRTGRRPFATDVNSVISSFTHDFSLHAAQARRKFACSANDRNPVPENSPGDSNWHVPIVRALKDNDVRLIVYVPDNVLRPLIEAAHADDFFTTFTATREEEAVGIVCGAAMAGLRGIVLMQTSGFATLANVLASLAVAAQIPALLMVSERGTLGDFQIAQAITARAMRPILQSLGHRTPHDHPAG